MEQNIPEVVRDTAKNVYALLMQLASHVEKLEADIADLKTKLEVHADDFK